MTELRSWLDGLGLAEYAEAFESNHIDLSLLPSLTGGDLREIGIASLGHRKRLLAAIETLAPSGDVPESLEPQAAEPSTPPKPAGPGDGERRQITVIFCDLVGSTALSEKLDPEDLSALIKSYRDICASAIAEHDGHVAQYLGDGVMAYFGWPTAHEDDAARAVRAAFDIVRDLGANPGNEPLRVRIGVETGAVVVGAANASDSQLAVGDTPYVASAIQALANPGEVVVGPVCRGLLGGAFELDDQDPQLVRGLVEPIAVSRVVRATAAGVRFDSARAAIPLVARETEVAMLIERWRRAVDGEGQVVLVSGEAGIGKSRIVQALREHIKQEPHIRLRYQSTENHIYSAFHPLMDFLVRAAQIERDDTPDQKLDKIEAVYTNSAHPPAETAALYAPFLGIPTGDRYPPSGLSPTQLRAKAIRFITEDLAALARQQPTFMLVEDAQWLDPSSLEALTAIIQLMEPQRILLVITFRPEFKPPWSGYPHVTSLSLVRMNRRQAAEMIKQVAGGKHVPRAAVSEIVNKTDGVPLFIEEVTKAILESDDLIEDVVNYRLAAPLSPIEVPASLNALLLTRLDRLGPGKEVAQVGAVIGREFSRDLVSALLDDRGLDVDAALEQLIRSEVVVARGRMPHASYSFRHALLRDAAYQSLLRSKRQDWHGRIAQALQERFAEEVDTAPEVLAHHLTASDQRAAAIEAWLRAGRLAAEHSAHEEAINHLRAGLDLVAQNPDDLARDKAELPFLLALGPSLLAHRGYTSGEAGDIYARACELCEKLDDTENLFPALFGVWVYHWNGGDLNTAYQVGEEFLRRSDGDQSDEKQMIGHRSVGLSLTGLGRPEAACEHLERARDLYKPDIHKALRYLYAQDPWVSASGFLAFNLVARGDQNRALEVIAGMIEYARGLGHPFSLAYAYFCAALAKLLAGSPISCADDAMAGVELAAAEQFPLFHAYMLFMCGAARAADGDYAKGIAEMQQGLTEAEMLGAVVWWPVALIALARAFSEAGAPQQAADAADEALQMAERRGELFAVAEVYRLKGDLAGTDAEAEPWYQKALDTARDQGATGWQLRAANALAELWVRAGKARDACDLLAPLVESSAEPDGTPDVGRAKEILKSISG